MGWRSTKIAEKISGLCQLYQRWIYCWPEGFIPWLINLQPFDLNLSWSSDSHGSVQIGSLTILSHDHIAFIDDTACPGRKTAFWLASMLWTVNLSLKITWLYPTAYTKGVKGKLKLSISPASKGHKEGIEARKPGVACAYSCLIIWHWVEKLIFFSLSDTCGIVCFNNYNFLFHVAYKEFGWKWV